MQAVLWPVWSRAETRNSNNSKVDPDGGQSAIHSRLDQAPATTIATALQH